MGAAAARLTDRVVGADTHVVMVPAAPSPVPTPLPGHPFAGTLTSGGVTTVLVEGSPAAVVGTTATNSPAHVPLPPGTSFASPPSNSGRVSSGSATVTVGGRAAARVGDPVRTCNDPQDADTSAITTGAGTVTVG